MCDFVMCDERRGGEGAERECDEEERKRGRDGWIDLGEAQEMWREGLNPVLSMESATWEFIMCCATTVCQSVCMYIYIYTCIYILL